MRKRWLLTIGLLCLCLLIVSGSAAAKKSSKKGDRNAIRNAADSFVSNLFNGQFKSAYELLSSRVRGKISESDFVDMAKGR